MWTGKARGCRGGVARCTRASVDNHFVTVEMVVAGAFTTSNRASVESAAKETVGAKWDGALSRKLDSCL